jgi:4-hydroxy-3-polyprenylbenzoate decarboxylase
VTHLKSLREYIDRLKALGEVQEISTEVDWHLELGAIVRRSYELRAPAPLFQRIKGIEPGFRVLGAPAGVSCQPGLFLCRIALSLGLPATSSAREIVAALTDAHDRKPLPPRRVTNGPCKENKLLGEAVDLWRLPTPYIHDGDGGRYLNTWGTVVVQTPDRQWTNWSISRMMVTGKNTLAGLVLPQQHLGMIYAQWQAQGKSMPFALALGTEPVIPFVSGMPLDDGVNEADFIGGYLGEPVEVIDCETVDLQVPATSEIVLEGMASVTETVPEGPMGEYSGYLDPGRGSMQPVFHVSAMTYRHEPILPVVAAGEPIEENHTCWGLAISGQVLWELRRRNLPAAMCFCPFASAGHWLVITIDRSARGQRSSADLMKELADVLFHSRAGSLIPKIFVLDDDIDPTNLEELVWAIATRCHPQRGPVLFPGEPVLPLVGYLDKQERRDRRSTKALYNCLRPDHLTADELPKRSSFRHAWPREIQERVVENWHRYGYADSGTLGS